MRYLKIFGFGVLFALAGMALYVFVLQKVDCSASSSAMCVTYNGLATAISAYGNFVMRFVSPACVGGGSDTCIGPALMIMLITLIAIGSIIGYLLFRDRKDRIGSGPSRDKD